MDMMLASRILLLAAGILFGSAVSAEDKAVDWSTLSGTKVTLEKGLAAAQRNGKPISGKFEVEDGALQLSTYTARNGKYYEVIIDHNSGKVGKTEEIKEGEDLTNAKAQGDAMKKAKKSLRSAVSQALAANRGYRALGATPSLVQGQPVATIVLENAQGKKTVSEKLN